MNDDITTRARDLLAGPKPYFHRDKQAYSCLSGLLTEVERLKGALESVRVLAGNAAGIGWRDIESQSVDEATGMQTVGEIILTEIEFILRGDQ